ncbi:hypothetical protein PEL8287_03482 [Roseovarius litorisediminis]|uniref:Uncharacterized protein n=2 Tax=Roseovarius litorisediminis TaxID=1312363 RepID=A0A1Y5TGS0_9RHOB|nr:hypothetical protein PEL8287_03482 [Roseovarius litorisediminis]
MLHASCMTEHIKRQPYLSVAFVLAVLPTALLANVPIFFVFAGVRVLLWWTIILAILIEAIVLWWIFDTSLRRALWAAFLINIGTTVLGFFIYPMVGTLSYPVLAPIITDVFGTGQLVELSAYCIAAAVVDTPVELLLLAILSAMAGYGFKITWKTGLIFFLANLVSAGILIAALQFEERKRPIDPETLQAIEQEFAPELEFAKMVFRELPNHTQPENGELDPGWRAEISAHAKQLNFVELTVATGKKSYIIVPLPNMKLGESYTYTYGQDSYQGTTRFIPGTLERWHLSENKSIEKIDVLHVQLSTGPGSSEYHNVRSILALPADW